VVKSYSTVLLLIEVGVALLMVGALLWLNDTYLPTAVVPPQVKFLIDAAVVVGLFGLLLKVLGLWH
jgi:hypothetical protein